LAYIIYLEDCSGSSSNTSTLFMIQNYLKIAWRNLLKHKGFSFINILGLAIGIGSCLIIFLYVHDELTFDLYNVKADRIARVTTRMHTPESDLVIATSPIMLAGTLKRDYPEVESTVRLLNAAAKIKFNNEIFSEESFYKTDQNIFSVFSFDFLEGSPTAALQNPRSIVITETINKKYFGKGSALGKIIACNGENLQVTGIIKDRPANSDMKIDALLSFDFSKTTVWMDDFDNFTFVLFYRKSNFNQFQRKLVDLSRKYIQPELDAGGGPGGAGRYKVEFELEPLSDVHFSTGKLADMPKGNKQFNYIFSLLAVFILIIALLNYINLSTAKSTERAREVGIRKVSGATQFQLVQQFLFESFFLLAVACLLAIGMVEIGLPFFNKLLQTKLFLNWSDGILFMGIIFLVTLFFAGLYPAFVLSAFKPVQVLKGNWRHSFRGVVLRKTITITQFAIAAALIMGTTVIYNQMKYVERKDLGFNKDELLNIFLPVDSVHMSSVKAFQNDLRERPEIKGITTGGGLITASMSSTITTSEGKRREFMCVYYPIDPQFLSVFQIPLIEGRNISDSLSTDRKEAFLVNEAFLKSMGWKSGVGRSIEGWEHKGEIVGVMKNFYFKSLHDVIEPVVMVYNTFPINTTTVKIKPRDLPVVKALFKRNLPEIPIDYSFFDEIVNKQYLKDRITMSLFNTFTILAILVSCLGLYGLVALIAVQRTKEIGIRKVLGATLKELLSLMTRDFMKLVFWALVIALPLAGIAMYRWLGSYAYHVQLSWWMFLIPVLLILFIALAVISREIIKTALSNPVTSLRSE
jgi:putative ABC transport system permease protein